MDVIIEQARGLDPDRDVNLVVLRGTIAAPPDLRPTRTGGTRLRMLVTVRTSQPRRRVDVVPVVMWDPPQQAVDTVRHQARVWVAAIIHRNFWEAPEGRRSRLEVVAHHVELDTETAAEVEGGDPGAEGGAGEPLAAAATG